MACWWICESIPLPATALVPLAAFPLMKVIPAGEVAASYASSSIFLFMGGFFIAVAMKRWNLHRRIALKIISVMGLRGDRVILGFMIATAFLSMWISNTATTMMMLPIGLAVIVTLEEEKDNGRSIREEGEMFGEEEAGRGEKTRPADKEGQSAPDGIYSPPDKQRYGLAGFKMALMLSVAYAANIGGIGTLIGTPPNVVFASQVHSLYPQAGEISFVKWMMIGLPLAALFLPLTWILLTRLFIRGPAELRIGENVMAEQEEAMGPMSAGERRTLTVFIITVLAWITRADVTVGSFTFRGWASVASLGQYIHDSTIAVAAGLSLFIIPVNWRKGIFVLNWSSAREIPWGILILFGGGIALGKGFSGSGLAQRIASTMGMLGGSPLIVILLITCLLVTFLTEITSNTAVATIFLPILGATAVGMGMHPFVLMIPATISASCAFMLPVATPPNAIVFSSGSVSVPGMVRAGVILNFLGVLLVTSLMYLLVARILGFSLTEVPGWVNTAGEEIELFSPVSGSPALAVRELFLMVSGSA